MSVPIAYVPSPSMVALGSDPGAGGAGASGDSGAGGGGVGSGSAWAVAADAAEPTRTIAAAKAAVLADTMGQE
jgi:hypothetical protein